MPKCLAASIALPHPNSAVSWAGAAAHDRTVRICPGEAGWQVLVSEDDLRETVSVRHDVLQPAGNGCASLVRSVQFGRDHDPMAHAERQTGCDHLALAPDDDGDEDQVAAKAMLVVMPCRRAPCATSPISMLRRRQNLPTRQPTRPRAIFACGKDDVKVMGNSGRAVELATRR